MLDLEIGLAVHLHAALIAEQGQINDARTAIETHPRTVGQYHIGLHTPRCRDDHRMRLGHETVLDPQPTHEPTAADHAHHDGRSRSIACNPHPESSAADAQADIGPHYFPHLIGHGIDSGAHPNAVQQFGQPAAIAFRTFDHLRYLRLLFRILNSHDFSFSRVYS